MADAKLVIDGREYPLPIVSSMVMGEARVLKKYTGKSLDELEELSESDPDLVAAVCHIAILRENPAATFAQIEKQVDAINLASLQFTRATGEDDARPPARPEDASGVNNFAERPSGLRSASSTESLQETTPPPTGVRV